MNTEAETSSPPIAAEISRRNGKVARLPKSVRDQINQMLLDGVFYSDIIKNLGERGKHLHISNLSRWKDGGFQDWLKDRQQVEAQRILFEGVTNLVAKTDAEQLPDVTVKLVAAHVANVLTQLTPTEFRANATGTPQSLPRILSLIPRLSHEALRTRMYRDVLKKEKGAGQS